MCINQENELNELTKLCSLEFVQFLLNIFKIIKHVYVVIEATVPVTCSSLFMPGIRGMKKEFLLITREFLLTGVKEER